MDFMDRLVRRFRPQRRPRYALALAGGGVIGGMYEGGVVAAMEEQLTGGRGFGIYVGCSAGFFSLVALERYMRETLAAGGLRNSFSALDRTLLIPAIDLDRAQRVVFGRDGLRDVPISEAVAASSAIPGFFEPYTLRGRDYVDGGVGFSGHADLAAEAGADVVIVVNPLVPNPDGGVVPLRNRGLYTIMEQAGRIFSQNLLQLRLSTLPIKHPRTEFHLIQPTRDDTPLFGPSMGFEASRAALRYGYESTKGWLEGQGLPLLRRLRTVPEPV